MATNGEIVPAGEIVQADKLVRLATLSRAMLEEARSAPCDAAGCERLRRIYERTIAELGSLLPATLRNELVLMSVTFEEPSPSRRRSALPRPNWSAGSRACSTVWRPSRSGQAS